jgi:hypothetical protein
VLVYRGKGACSAPVGGPSTPTLTTMAEGGIGVEEPQAPLAVNGRDVWSTLPDFSRDVDMLALSQNKQVRVAWWLCFQIAWRAQKHVATWCG